MPFAFSLIKKERIGGLEINETGVFFALVSLDRANGKYTLVQYAEEPLKKGALSEGLIVDHGAVAGALIKLLKRISLRVPYCILSIPPNAVYQTIISLPLSLDERRREEALKLAADFQLPFAKGESYYDSEEVWRDERRFFLLIAAKKTAIDPYIASCIKAGIKPIAVEVHQRSIARVVAVPPGSATLITMENASSTTAFVLKDKKLWLTQVFPNARGQKKEKELGIARIANFYETEYGKISSTTTIHAVTPTDEWNTRGALPKDTSRWYGALGAAARGALPREDDTYPSLMAIGTKEAFRSERALAFTHLLMSVSIGIGLFFIAMFAASWIFLSSVRETLLQAREKDTGLLLPPGIAEAEDEVKQFSELLSLVNGFVAKTPRFSTVIGELQRNIPDTITITSFSVTSSTNATLSGVAKGRGDLNQLKRRLEEVRGIHDVILPLTNLDVKENIPFTITIHFQDTALYDTQ